MPSSLQTVAMILYASWCCWTSVQVAIEHISALQQLPTSPRIVLRYIAATFVTALLLSLKQRWLEEPTTAPSTSRLPPDTSHVAHISRPPVLPELVAAPTVMPVAAQELPPRPTRKQRRRLYQAKQRGRAKEDEARKQRERLSRHSASPSIAYSQQPLTWYQQAPGAVFPASVPLTTHNYYAPLSSFGSYSAASPTPYSEINRYYANWAGFNTPLTQWSQHQMPQQPHGLHWSIPQWSANVPGLSSSSSSDYAPSGAHTPAVLHGSAPQCQILDDCHIEGFHLPSKCALEDVPCGTSVASDLKVDEIDLAARMRVGGYVEISAPANADTGDRDLSVSIPKVADLSWVTEKDWHRPALKRMARVQTAPLEHVCHEASRYMS